MSEVDLTAAPLKAARDTLASALAAVGFDVHQYGSANLATPCVVLEPNGWSPSQASGTVVAYTVNVWCLYNTGTLATSADGAEEMARLVYKALAGAGWLPADVPAPTGVTYNERQYVGVQLTAGTRTTI